MTLTYSNVRRSDVNLALDRCIWCRHDIVFMHLPCRYRTGSTFTSFLLSLHQDVFFLFEPLQNIQRYASPRFYVDKDAAVLYLKEVFACDFTDLYDISKSRILPEWPDHERKSTELRMDLFCRQNPEQLTNCFDQSSWHVCAATVSLDKICASKVISCNLCLDNWLSTLQALQTELDQDEITFY